MGSGWCTGREECEPTISMPRAATAHTWSKQSTCAAVQIHEVVSCWHSIGYAEHDSQVHGSSVVMAFDCTRVQLRPGCSPPMNHMRTTMQLCFVSNSGNQAQHHDETKHSTMVFLNFLNFLNFLHFLNSQVVDGAP